MNNNRIENHPILGVLEPQKTISFQFDQKTYQGLEGEPIAAAMLANGIRTLRLHEETGNPRGIYCNIGHCYECRVTVNGQDGVRACLTPIKEGMDVESGKVLPTPFKNENSNDD
jgi:sarcosine oxidase subunit alpha